MLCHGWVHGAPLLAQLLCQAFSVNGQCWELQCWDYRFSYSAVFSTAGKGLLLLIDLYIFSCGKNGYLSLKVFKLHVWLHLEINSSCVCACVQAMPTWKRVKLLAIWPCIFGFYKEGHTMEVCVVLIHLLKNIKTCSSDALYGMEILLLTSKPQTALPGREPSINSTPPWTDSYRSSPLCPHHGCLSITKPATSAGFLSLLRMGLELFTKSEYIATLLLIYLFICTEQFLFWVCSKAGALPDLAGSQR